MTSKTRCVKTKREPVEMSVAEAMIIGPLARRRSPKVAPLNRISSYSCAATSERPMPVDPSVPQLAGLITREMISPCTSRFRKRCS